MRTIVTSVVLLLVAGCREHRVNLGDLDAASDASLIDSGQAADAAVSDTARSECPAELPTSGPCPLVGLVCDVYGGVCAGGVATCTDAGWRAVQGDCAPLDAASARR